MSIPSRGWRWLVAWGLTGMVAGWFAGAVVRTELLIGAAYSAALIGLILALFAWRLIRRTGLTAEVLGCPVGFCAALLLTLLASERTSCTAGGRVVGETVELSACTTSLHYGPASVAAGLAALTAGVGGYVLMRRRT